MTYDLFIGDRTFSSWSLRGWLMLEKFRIPHRVHMTGLYSDSFAQDLAPLAPARFVPVLRTPDGIVIGESLAMAETLAERHPAAGLWPVHESHRARARWLCAEMASGFSALRSDCPMQLQHVNAGFEPSEAVRADLSRIETIWNAAWELAGTNNGWLLGDYSLVDVFYTPVAARIVGYNLPVSEVARAYCLRLLEDPAVKAWRAEGQKINYDSFPYPIYEPLKPWPIV